MQKTPRKRKTSIDKSTSTRIATLKSINKLSEREISELTNIPKTTVHDELQRLIKSNELIAFTDNKDKVFEALQLQLINLADRDSLKTMLSKRGFTDVAILQDKIQLLRGQSVSIHDVNIRVLLDAVMPGYQGNSGPVMDAEVTNPLIQANAPLPDKAIPPEDSPDVP
jgi:hypothetical protein